MEYKKDTIYMDTITFNDFKEAITKKNRIKIQKNSRSSIILADIIDCFASFGDGLTGFKIENKGNGIFMVSDGFGEFWGIEIKMVDNLENKEWESY